MPEATASIGYYYHQKEDKHEEKVSLAPRSKGRGSDVHKNQNFGVSFFLSLFLTCGASILCSRSLASVAITHSLTRKPSFPQNRKLSNCLFAFSLLRLSKEWREDEMLVALRRLPPCSFKHLAITGCACEGSRFWCSSPLHLHSSSSWKRER